MKKLEDTIDLMTSSSYKERFMAEYWQTKIRYERLKNFNNQIEAATISEKVDMPIHDCPNHLLKEQQSFMGYYLNTLEVRAIIEGIDLESAKYKYLDMTGKE